MQYVVAVCALFSAAAFILCGAVNYWWLVDTGTKFAVEEGLSVYGRLFFCCQYLISLYRAGRLLITLFWPLGVIKGWLQSTN